MRAHWQPIYLCASRTLGGAYREAWLVVFKELGGDVDAGICIQRVTWSEHQLRVYN